MNILLCLVVFFLAECHVMSSPVPPSRRSLTINQVLKPRSSSDTAVSHRGIVAYARALAKYGASVDTIHLLSGLAAKHEPQTKRSAQGNPPNPYPQVAGPLDTYPGEYDISYTAVIVIGDQQFFMDFDTGSSDLWVYGPDITGLAANQTNWHQSSTSQQLDGYTFYIGYGDGSFAEGDVWTDQIMLGSVIIPHANVEVANSAGGNFEAPISGIVGLAFDSLNNELITANLISSPVFSTVLNHNAPGYYTFGDIPSWQHSGAVVYTPVDSSSGYWSISPSGYGICITDPNASKPSTFNSTPAASSTLPGVVDTGTTLIILADDIVNDYYSSVASAMQDFFFVGGWFFDCTEILPDLKIQVGEGNETYVLTIPGTYLNYAPIDDGSCYGGVQSTMGDIPFNIYGDMFIKSAFLVFDRGDDGVPRIGFADKAVDNGQ